MSKVILIIMDGWGYSKERKGNAIRLGKTPHIDDYFKRFNHSLLDASGEAVGLPAGTLGGSEVGHLHIGAGRHVLQDLSHINKSIKDGSFFRNRGLLEAFRRAKKGGKSVHLFGLLSDGGVHSHISHLFALLEMAKKSGVKRVYIHCFLDGRDVPPRSARKYLRMLEKKMEETGVGSIGTISGRYYSMDRDRRWERTKKAYDAMVLCEGRKAKDAKDAISQAYAHDENDEFVTPTVLNGFPGIKDGDSIIFFNFRGDRARQISRCFTDRKFEYFRRARRAGVYFICFEEYAKTINARVAFSKPKIRNHLVEFLSMKGKKILKAAETEKYAHVTFFFNAGTEKPFPGEDRILIPSPKVATYDLKPEMSAFKIRDALLRAIRSEKYDLIVVNFANPDMVAHTGVLKAGIRAVEVVDECVGELIELALSKGYEALVTADHGNAEDMLEHGKVVTAHSLNPVPCFVLSDRKYVLRKRGGLVNIAPTILELMGVKRPKEMTADSLIVHK